MAKYVIEDTTLTGIADAIRAKTGGTDPIPVTDMAGKIENIGGGEAVEEYDGTITVTGEPTACVTEYDGTIVVT